MSGRLKIIVAALAIAQLPFVGLGATTASAASSPVTECAAALDPAPANPSDPGYGSIGGTIGYEGTETLAGALVQATPAGGGMSVNQYTDTDGNYRFTDLAEGDWVIRADTNPTTGFQYYCDTADEGFASAIAITSGNADWVGVNVLFQQPGRIEGTVTLDAAPVTANTSTYFINAEPVGGGAVIGTQLQPDGSYRFDNVADGTYVVWVNRMMMGDPFTPRYHPSTDNRMVADSVTIDETTRIQSGINIALVNNQIHGTVTAGAVPVAGATVTADRGPAYMGTAPTAITDANGDYTLGGLSAGDYRISVKPINQTTTRYYGGGTNYYNATVVTLNEQNSPIIGRDIVLSTGGFTGTLTDGTNPIPSRTLTFTSTSSDPMMMVQFTDTTTTDASGTFTVAHLPSGTYAISVNDPATYSNISLSGTFTTGSTIETISPVLPTGSISGVAYRDGLPINGTSNYTTVYLDRVSNGGTGMLPPPRTLQVGVDGSYTFNNVADGDYYVSMAAMGSNRVYHPSSGSTLTATIVTVSSASPNPTGVDITAPSGSISGAVTASGATQTSATGSVYLTEVGGGTGSRWTSLNNGIYSFTEVPDGNYVVSINLSGTMTNLYHPSGNTLAGATTISVGPGNRTLTAIDVAIPIGRISGTIAAGATPLSNVQVQAYDLTNYQRGSAQSLNGFFAIGNLPNGIYRIGYSLPGGGQAWYGGNSFASATPIVVSDGEPEPPAISITLPTGVIEGTVLDGVNPPSGYTTVELIDAGTMPPGTMPTSRNVGMQPDGSFRFDNVANGTYRIRYNQMTGGSGFYPGGTTQAGATLLTIDATTQTISNVTIQLPSGTITGVVRRGATPLDGTMGYTQVTLTTLDGSSSRSAPVSAIGVYEFTGVGDGDYVVSYSQMTPYVQTYHPGTTSRAEAAVVNIGDTDRDRTGIDIALPDGTISGRITAPGDAGVPSATAQVFGPNNTQVATALSQPNGDFTVTGLPDGIYRVAVVPPSSISQTWRNGTSFANAEPIMLAGTDNDAVGIDITLPGGSITGVLFNNGVPAAFTTIGIEPATSSARVNIQTGAAGSFTFRYLNAGNYRLSTQINYQQITLPGIYSTDGITVTDVSTIEIPQGRIGGAVTRAGVSVTPSDSIQVTLEQFPQGYISTTRTTQVSNGTYQFDNVAPGAYRVRFSSMAGNVSGYAPGVAGYDGAEVIEISAGLPQRTDVDIALPSATIAGSVTLGGAPLSSGIGYSVTAEPAVSAPYPGGSGVISGAAVNPDGSYVITGLRPGSYRVKVSTASTYPTPTSTVTAYHPAAGNAYDAEAVTIASDGEALTGIGIDITAGTVSGFVTQGGAPVDGTQRGITVLLREPLTTNTRQVQVGANGGFSFSPIGDSDYTLAYSDQSTGTTGYYPLGATDLTATALSVSPTDRIVDGLDIELPSLGSLGGLVTDSDGDGLATTVTLRARPSGGVYLGPTTKTTQSDSNGSYDFTGVAVGDYTISIETSATSTNSTPVYAPGTFASSNADYVTVTAGATATLSMQVPGEFTFEGVVRDGVDQPVAGVKVYVIEPNNFMSQQGALVATTGVDGTYVSSNVVAREYVVRFEPPTSSGLMPTFHGAPSYSAATIIDPAPGVDLIEDVDGAVGEPATITGTITDANGDPAPAWVGVFPVGARNAYEINVPTAPRQKAAPNGTFSFDQLPPGEWVVRAEATPASGYTAQALSAPTYFGDTLDRSLATPIVLGSGATEVADIQVVLGQTLSGQVTDPDGNPIVGMQVSTNPISPIDPFFSGRSSSTGPDGRYEIIGLVPGDQFQVSAFPGGTAAFVGEYHDDTYVQADALLVTVPATGTMPDIDFELARSIMGTAVTVNSDGDTISDSIVGATACRAPSIPAGFYGCTDSAATSLGQRGDDGLLYFTGLAPGSYNIAARAGGTSAARTSFTLAAGETFSCILPTTRAGGEASCTVRPNDATATVTGRVHGPDGTPLPGAQVALLVARNTHVVGAITDANGDYAITQVPAGSYRVGIAGPPMIFDSNRPVISEWYHSSGIVYQDSITGQYQANYATGEVVAIADGADVILDDVTLEQYPTGTATVTGGPVPVGASAFVTLCPAPHQPAAGSSACLDPSTGAMLSYATALQLRNGVFVSDYVFPGTYNVAGRSTVSGDMNAEVFTKTATLTIAGSQDFTCELPLIGAAGDATCTATDIDFPPPPASDDDGVPAEVEDAAPNDGDGDGDDIPDSQQANVASLVDPSLVIEGTPPPPESYITIRSNTPVIGTTAPAPLTAVSAVPLSSLSTQPPAGGINPTALLSFTADYRESPMDIVDQENPVTATFVVYLPNQANRYWKYDASADPGAEWTDASSLVDFAPTPESIGGVDRWKATITIVDGAFGDEDGVVNGVVVDPATFSYVAPDITPPTITCPAAPTVGFRAGGATLIAQVTDGDLESTLSVALITSTPGGRTVDVTAEDDSGNSTTVSCGYDVRYTVQSIMPFIDAGLRSVRNNTTVPFTFRVVDANGAPVLGNVASAPSIVPMICPGQFAIPLLSASFLPEVTFSVGGGAWYAGWRPARQLKNSCQEVTIAFDDGTELVYEIKVT